MSISVGIDGVSILDGIPPASIQASSAANGGEAAFGGFDVEDPNGTLTIAGHRRVTITESDCSQSRLFTGWITERGIGRDKEHALIVGEERGHDVTTVDLNALFAFRPIAGSAGNRPSETWNARLAWLLGSSWLSGLVENDTTYCISITRVMDAANYRDQPPSAVLDDLIDRWPYPLTYFAFYDPSDGKIKLYFNRISATDLTSTLTISNVKSELSATCFEPDSEAVLTRAPDQTYSEVVIEYSHGMKRLFRSRGSTAAAYIRRGTKISRPYTGSLATAMSQGAYFLDTHATEEDRISVTITVPPASAGLVWAGQRILVKFTHLPGYTTSTSMRVISCTATPTDGTVSRYAIALELVAPRPAAVGTGACSGITRVQEKQVGGSDQYYPVNNFSLNLDAAPTAPNLLVAIVTCRDDPRTVTVDGFTFVGDSYTAVTEAQYVSAFVRTTGAGDGTTVTARTSAASFGTAYALQVVEYCGAVFGSGTLAALFNDATTTPNIPAFTPATTSPIFLIVGTVQQPSEGQTAAGYTIVLDTGLTGAGNRNRMMFLEKYVASPSGPYSGQFSGLTDASTKTNVIQFAITENADTTVDLGPAPGATVPSGTPTPAADGTTVLFTCATGYTAGTLVVYVDGIPIPSSEVTETDPAAGTFTLSWAPDTDEVIRVLYIVG